MKFSSKSDVRLISTIITVLWISTCQVLVSGLPDPQSSPEPGDHLSNADLHHLLSLLDGSVSDQPSLENQHGLMDDLDFDASELSELVALTTQPTTTTTDVPTTAKSSVAYTKKIIRRRKTTTTSTPEPTLSTTTTTTQAPTQSPTTTPEPTTTTTTTTTTTETPVTEPEIPLITRREDNQIDNLRALVPPSQHELVQQLSLLNSLLTSLGDNSTADVVTPTAEIASQKDMDQASSDVRETVTTITESSPSSTTPIINKNVPEDPAAALQSLALLNSLFGGSSASPGNGNSNAALLGLGNPSNLATRQTQGLQSEAEAAAKFAALLQSAALASQTGKKNLADVQNSPGNNAQSDADLAATLSALLQSASVGGQNSQTSPGGHLQNFQNTNGNLDAASSNQISGLLSLLGTLGSLGQQPQQTNSLFNLAQNNPVQSQQNNFLANLLGGQQQQPQANALGNLFGAASQPQQNQALNLANLFASQNQAPSIPGLGLLSTMGSLGSSIFSTMSSVLGGSGLGGKPRVRGKGVDTRLGLGYRFGDAADAQIVWDIGPQLFTDPLRNEARPPTMKSKSQQVEQNHQVINAQARIEKQQQMVAAKRLLNLQRQQQQIHNYQLSQRRLSNVNLSTKKPLSLLDMWNFGKSEPSVSRSKAQIPQQLMIPPAFMRNIDPLRVFRTKSFMKRSSGPQDQKPYYKDKPFDDPFAGHSTLTTYEKMLLTHGKDFGMSGKRKPSLDNSETPSEIHNQDDNFEGSSNNEQNNAPQFSSYHTRNKETRTRRPPFKNAKNPPPRFSQEHTKNAHNRNRNRRPRPEPKHRIKNSNVETESSDFQKHNNDFKESTFKNTKNPPRSFNNDRPRNSNKNNKPQRPEQKPKYQDEDSHASNNDNVENFSHVANDDNLKQNHEGRPRRRPNKDVKRRKPGFSLRNIFRLRRKPTRRGPPPRKDDGWKDRMDNGNPQLSHFKNTNSDMMMMADSNDRFHTRNHHPKSGFKNYHDEPQNSFVRKISKVRSKSSQLVHKDGDEVVALLSTNPEADDSFIRRNTVAPVPQLQTSRDEKPKQFQFNSPNSSALPKNGNTRRQDMETSNVTGQKKSVMNYIRNFLSSKPIAKSSSQNHNVSSSSSITSLKSFFSDPSSLNPLKILPYRRPNRPTPQPSPKTKLTMVNGKPQIVEVKEALQKSEPIEAEPVVHVGEDMSFEDLTALFGSAKNGTKSQGRKKLKSKKKADSRKDEDLEVKLVDSKVNKKEEKKAKDDIEEDEEEYEDDDDGLKGIFIDIDSGEVNVMKPVASLTSFEPKKESEEEEVDEYEDEDGDGVADADTKRKQEIFEEIQKELKRNYEKMKKTQERADAKKKRKQVLVSKGMDESVDVVSKYFDMLDDSKDTKKGKHPRTNA